MGSYSQVVVGIMLLVVAFFFGRYINQQPMANKETAEQPELIGAFESASIDKTAADSNVSPRDEQNTLRDRILRQRKQGRQNDMASPPPETAHESLANTRDSKLKQDQKTTASFNSIGIVEPDFSHLGINAFENPLPKELPQDLVAKETRPGNRLPTAVDAEERVPRFSINRPDPGFRNQKRGNEGYHQDVIAARKPNRRLSDNVVGNFRSRRELSKQKTLVPDNPRYRMVPVRERIGKWNPEPSDYINYTTVFGDSLHSLSTKFYGSSERYLDIYLANQELLESPSDVPVNTEIRIPVIK